MKTTNRAPLPGEFASILQSLLIESPTRPLLDLGCGEIHYTRDKLAVWIDLDPHHAKDPRVLIMDVREAPHVFRRMRFSTALLIDLIEHLPKADGLQLLRELEPLAARLLIFTPLGEMWVGGDPTSPHTHRCGWLSSELEQLGYETWVWPLFHKTASGHHGAFFAWKDV